MFFPFFSALQVPIRVGDSVAAHIDMFNFGTAHDFIMQLRVMNPIHSHPISVGICHVPRLFPGMCAR